MANITRNMNNNSNVGIGLLDVLQIIFIVLKLTGLIDWSWPIVLIPLWIGLGIVLIIIILYLLSD